jgi:XTP/dITP diphosphohydrolase
MAMKLVAATKNPGKLREFQHIFRRLPVEIESLAGRPGIELPAESGGTYLENASAKAWFAARALGLPAFGDDSGLEVDALGGAPGLRSARFASPDGNPRKNIPRLLERMKGVPAEKRTARFKAVIVLVFPDHHDGGRWKEKAFEGVFEGTIAMRPEGEGGFGYDPVFISPKHGKTVALLTEDEKEAVSHRGIAARKMIDFIEKNLL